MAIGGDLSKSKAGEFTETKQYARVPRPAT
jgi:hypothetical protein